MKILLIRMMGLGDVASILIPAVKLFRTKHPDAEISVLTYGAGNELMPLVPQVHSVFTIEPEQWPGDIIPAMESFFNIATSLLPYKHDLIVNLDTWFMPCLMARALMDAGLPFEGNHLSMSTAEFIDKLAHQQISADYIYTPARYLESTYANMKDWVIPWWNKYPDAGSYPQFYLNHCCGFKGEVEIALDLPVDKQLLEEAQGRRIIALSASGRIIAKQYPHAEELRHQLQEAGFHVWGEFNSTIPMATTLGRLRASDLLVTVPTSTQWLAKLMGCPSLLIPGPQDPRVLGAELTVAKSLDCQYCWQQHCPANLDFACMKIPPNQIVEMVIRHFNKLDKPLYEHTTTTRLGKNRRKI